MKNNRRKLLKALTLGGGAVTITKLPTTWSKPVLESVMLPAHAQTSGLCVLQVHISLKGTFEGGSSYQLFDSSTCYFSDGNAGPVEFTTPYDLGPGTYYFDGSFGFSGSATGLVEVTCCDQSEHVSESSSVGVQIARLQAIITIGDDGTCSIKRVTSLPPRPCNPM